MRRGIQRNTNYFVTRAVHVGSSNKVINKVKILVTLYLDIYIYIVPNLARKRNENPRT